MQKQNHDIDLAVKYAPRGLGHRTRAPQRTVMPMMEGATVTPTDDA